MTFGPLKASANPVEFVVSASNEIALKNVLVGEVWLASGQSNMQMAVGQALDAQKEIAAADWPQIREFCVDRIPAAVPAADLVGKWAICSPKTVGDFSAAGYFFARELHKTLKVPVGIVHSSWGATSAEPWTSRQGLAHQEQVKALLAEYDELTEPLWRRRCRTKPPR